MKKGVWIESFGKLVYHNYFELDRNSLVLMVLEW